MGVLEGLTVLDLSWGVAGPMATMLMADHGADVIRIERPGGEPFPVPDGYRVWQRGKRSATLDLSDPTDRGVVRDLARQADVVMTSFAPGVAERLGVDHASLRDANPRLISCAITGYGRANQHAARPAYDALVAARCGVQWDLRNWYGGPIAHVLGRELSTVEQTVPESIAIGSEREGPIFAAMPAASIAAAYLATLGVSAALRAREVTGAGQLVETSLMQGLMVTLASAWQRPEHPDAPGYETATIDRRQTWGILRASDGWVCTWTTDPHWLLAAGEGAELTIPEPGSFRRGVLPHTERLRALERAAPVVARFPVAAWVALAAEAGTVAIQPIRTPEEALCDPALLAEGSVAVIADPELGPLHQAGILYRLHGRPTRPAGPPPRRGEHTDQVRAEAAAAAAAEATERVEPTAPGGVAPAQTLGAGPLSGIRVVDFGLAVAGPWTAQMLADLGAEIIKVDPERQAGWFGNHMSLAVNRSKRSICLDMKQPDGAEVAHALIRGADVVTLNMRPQAAERLGLDYESVRRLNPRVVYCLSRGFEDGPRSRLPGNDQTANALAGTEWEDGGCWDGGRPWFGVTSLGDKGNGYLCAIAVVQALYDRERTGEGQRVDASIINGALFNNSRVYTTPDGRCFERPKTDRDQLGFSATYGLYGCASGWLCLAALTEAHWSALCTVVPALAADPRFADADARRADDAALREVLAAELGAHDATEWFSRLDRAGVPCEVSDPTFPQRLFDDADLRARGWTVGLEGNPVVGHIEMCGLGVGFSATPARPGGPPPVLGQHSEEILAELGYDEEAIGQLVGSGAVRLAATPASI